VPPVTRRYRPSTATLETVWAIDGGRLTLADGMIAEPAGRLLPATLLVRRLIARDGPIDVTIEFDPRFGEAHQTARAAQRTDALVCSRGSLAVALGTDPRIDIEPGRPVSVTVEPDRPLTLVLAIAYREPLVYVHPHAAWNALESDERRWQAWTEEIDADIPFRDAVMRSLLTRPCR
jgi:hypothetical protein